MHYYFNYHKQYIFLSFECDLFILTMMANKILVKEEIIITPNT